MVFYVFGVRGLTSGMKEYWFPGVLVCAFLLGCDSGGGQRNDSFTPQLPPSARNIISEQLSLETVNALSLDDGVQPLVAGDWPRYTPQTTWNWQLSGELDLDNNADVYVVDMFAQLEGDSISRLKESGRNVICYFSAGTFEFWRPDAPLFAALELGSPHVGFADENWLDITQTLVMRLMANRMDIAAKLGCNGVELDNVDGWVNDTGFTFGQTEQLKYNKVLANEAHKRGLSVALKNNVEMIPELVDYFDLVINEECFQYNECDGYRLMIDNGKPVFNAEYTQIHIDDPVERASLCAISRSYGFQTLILPLELDGSFRFSCS